MCRLVAYLGAPRPMADAVITPRHSLVAQSQEALEAKLSVNGDGFGIAWYGDRPEPAVFKDVWPAWSDSNLLNLCTHISARLFLAHVRASTEGETARANCHPFTYGRWSFMHNGQTGSFLQLRRALEAGLSDDTFATRRGGTDSELLFLMLVDAGLDADPHAAFEQVTYHLNKVAQDIGVKSFFRQTCVLSDGGSIYCYRYASDGRAPSLYRSDTFFPGGTVLASEPLDSCRDGWTEVPTDRVIRIDGPVAQAGAMRSVA